MIELITARGNTSLESALSLTKALRWKIQALGVRLSKAAADEELSRRGSSKAKSKAQNELELKSVVSDMRILLESIEDAVPLINLAITTSGVSLSTNLPATISPSRLLQASTFLSTGDSQYLSNPSDVMAIGPAFTLSLYMLFSGHANKPQDEEGLRSTIWKEVIHKARVKLVRVPLNKVLDFPFRPDKLDHPEEARKRNVDHSEYFPRQMPAQARSNEFAYQLVVIEDLDDDRVHTYENDDMQPSTIDDVALAGIREIVPIYEIAKIFYADTGKILNIGSDGETNNPILLIKRDVNASPPRRMMEREKSETPWNFEGAPGDGEENLNGFQDDDDASQIDAQFVRESTTPCEHRLNHDRQNDFWRLPNGLDPEWLAFEVYNEEIDFDSDSEPAVSEKEKPLPRPLASSRQESVEPGLSAAMSNIHINSSPPRTPSQHFSDNQLVPTPHHNSLYSTNTAPLVGGGSVRTSLSLLEMLIRLTSLQQFQQCSHLAINDELLNFFLEESSTTGAAPGDVDARKRIRMEARQHVGFDPYDESPIKRRGEQYQYNHDEEYDRSYDGEYGNPDGVRPSREESPLLLRSREHSSRSRSGTPERLGSHKPINPKNATPPMPGSRQGHLPPATPPGTMRSRQAFLRDEAGGFTPARSSPLTRNESRSSGIVESSDEWSPRTE